MRNKWFPGRVADYVPIPQAKRLKAQNVAIARDFAFGVDLELEEEEEEAADSTKQPKYYVRPIEIDILSVCYDSLAAAFVDSC